MKKLCLFLCFLGFCLSLCGQDTLSKIKCKHLLYLEIGGIGGIASVNYENNIALKNKFALGFRGGFSTVHLLDYTRKFNPDLIFPVSLLFLYGIKHQMEIGIGQTVSNIPAANMDKVRIHTRKTTLNTTFTAGYRFEHQKTGLFFKCSYTPIIMQNKYYKHWGGISIGYAFK